ncbi:MAG: MFS transporter [Bacteroidales bacterium]|nr:MFS transporter [Bacteroidales bacterium]
MSKKLSPAVAILYTFFVMGFCDVVGAATAYVKTDFNLSESLAGFIPSAVFIWFLLLSIPTALLMNKIGRKKTVQLSNAVTFLGMIIPFISYTLPTCLIAFALLGIGNTILQVSLNPLLSNVIKGDKLTSSMTAGQLIKAVCSLTSPYIALFATNILGGWQYIFPIFAGLTLLSAVWLMLTEIPKEERDLNAPAGAKETFKLLGDPMILMLFLGIIFVVGVDVGSNTVAPKLLMERVGLPVEKAGLGSSAYFLGRTVGALLGTFLLLKLNDRKYFFYNILFAVAALVALFFVKSQWGIVALLAAIGFTCSCIFTIIFSAAIQSRPEKTNEISGLMITGIVGGAIIPPLMGIATDKIGSQAGSLIIIGICMAYLVFCAVRLLAMAGKKEEVKE